MYTCKDIHRNTHTYKYIYKQMHTQSIQSPHASTYQCEHIASHTHAAYARTVCMCTNTQSFLTVVHEAPKAQRVSSPHHCLLVYRETITKTYVETFHSVEEQNYIRFLNKCTVQVSFFTYEHTLK